MKKEKESKSKEEKGKIRIVRLKKINYRAFSCMYVHTVLYKV